MNLVQTTMDTTSTPIRMVLIKKIIVLSFGEDVKKLESFCIVGGNVKMMCPLWKTV